MNLIHIICPDGTPGNTLIQNCDGSPIPGVISIDIHLDAEGLCVATLKMNASFEFKNHSYADAIVNFCHTGQ